VATAVRGRVSRTQAERTAATRARLLEATVECVAELGYANTSTTDVVRRAGLSRGAQVHHFPTKADLVVAAIDFVLERRQQDWHDAFMALPVERRDIPAALELMWEQWQGPAYLAWLELAVAARTDPALSGRVRALTDSFDQRSERLFAEFFPDAPDDATTSAAVSLAFAVLDGLALQRALRVGDADKHAVIDLLKNLATALPEGTDEP
jgi:AcrR family transcriptional regulator